MTMFHGRPALIAAGLALSACSTPDYSGVQSFANAVTSLNDADAALAAAAQQAKLNLWVQHSAAPGSRAEVDFGPCLADPAAYVAQACAVKVGGAPAPAELPDMAFTSLADYAALLVAVADDTTCGALQTDAAALQSDLRDMAALAKAPALSGELTSIASQAGCFFVARKQLGILRAATQDANPILARLVPVIQYREQQLYGIIQDDGVEQIKDAGLDYQATGAAGDLSEIASLTTAIDKAQLAPAYTAVSPLAALHQDLTDALTGPAVDLSAVVAKARMLVEKAQAAEGAAAGLGAAAVRAHDARAERARARAHAG